MSASFDLEDTTNLTKQFPALRSKNMGNWTLKMTMSISDLMDTSEVRNEEYAERVGGSTKEIAQREEKINHRKDLAKYIISALFGATLQDWKKQKRDIDVDVISISKHLEMSPYSSVQPIVVNLPGVKSNGEGLNWEKIQTIGPNGEHQPSEEHIIVRFKRSQKLMVIDGQHRRNAFGMAKDWLEAVVTSHDYPKKGLFQPPHGMAGGYINSRVLNFWKDVFDQSLNSSFVALECHLGLTVEQEGQLFNDSNKGLAVATSQRQRLDRANAINLLVRELFETKVIKFTEAQKDSVDWRDDTGSLTLKDVNTITSFATLGKGSNKGAVEADIVGTREFAKKFWEYVQCSPGFGKPGAKANTVLAQPVVLKGLAKLAHELGHGKGTVKDEEALRKLFEALKSGGIDFSHSNPLWRSLMLSSEKRQEDFPGIEKYVFVPRGTNLDAGTFDAEAGWVRYGSKHNDIYRRIGDLIRFKLKLKARPEVSKALQRED